MLTLLPIASSSGSSFSPEMVTLREMYSTRAKKMLRVPRVTMNGGSRSRVMSTPFSRPQASPMTRPMPRTSSPGIASSAEICPSTTVASSMMAPTDRSMPAVRMMIVWPMASVPTTMTCCAMRERLLGSRNRGDISEKAAIIMTSTNAGPMIGWLCSRCWRRCRGPRLGASDSPTSRVASDSAASVVLGSGPADAGFTTRSSSLREVDRLT